MCENIVLALFGFTLLAGLARADVTFINSLPYVISQPGQYHLAQDLTAGSIFTAITIVVSDVELHFDGHTLDGGTVAQIGVLAEDVSNISIFGSWTVTGFKSAEISLVSVTGARIVNMMVSGAHSGDATGILLRETVDSTALSNSATDNGQGIFLQSSSQNNILRANVTDGNHIGIAAAAAATNNLIQANQAHNNTSVDLADGNPVCSNTWKSNHFGTSSGPCIQ